ncbi:hypothetical protein G210_3264 [Candida maltosa Xu316]|uniref:Uncharacterized protein n=1 Tax=Candida maltosa (strain Xu316) TaxID=1245528 RepID=M3IJE1_CANMX|nr:hypothetical protein G210_3264 [Candida maltosa Xu316]
MQDKIKSAGIEEMDGYGYG